MKLALRSQERAKRPVMRFLMQRDLNRVLTQIQRLHACERREAFAFEVMSILLDLVPARGASFNRLDISRLDLLCQAYPKKTLEPLSERSRQNFSRFQHEHPFVALYRQTGGFGPMRTSDLMSQRRFERLAIYNEYYRPSHSRFQIEFTLPAPRDVCLCLALDRTDKNFSERDRTVLTLLRPHVAAAHRKIQMLFELKALERCVDPARGVIFVSATGRISHLTATAVCLLEKYFGKRIDGNLPEEISRWLCHQERLLGSEACLSNRIGSLVIERGTRRVEVQACREGNGQMLLLCESQAPLSHSARLSELGLTPRQAQVLSWIAQGKTNAEIGIILGASHHTIHQHVHAILRKLGVENRATAMLRALEILGLPAAS